MPDFDLDDLLQPSDLKGKLKDSSAGIKDQPPKVSSNGHKPSKIGKKISLVDAEAAEARAQTIPCPDPHLPRMISERLTAPKTLAVIRRQNAGNLVLSWLVAHGEFIQSETEELYYLYRDTRKLFKLNSNHWRAWLYSLTNVNPASNDFAYFQADCETASMLSKPRKVLRVAAWDKANKVLRVSRFDGTVYRLDGSQITEEGNGENVLFDDEFYWKPYDPDFSKPGVFAFTADAYFDSNETDKDKHLARCDQYRLALRIYELGIFFSELIPTKPMLAFVGEKGSGKSITLRRLGRSMFGPEYELEGVPNKPDGFTAAASSSHFLAIDNLDEFTGWLRDKLARITTGGMDSYRKLYTSNETGRVHYRVWLAFTSRTPDTLRRDDLADRLIILPVKRIPEKSLKAERLYLEAADINRNAWWGDVLTTLNRIVAGVRAGQLQDKAILRMADWESFGRLVAQIENKESVWDEFISGLKGAQSNFLLEGDVIANALIEWVESPMSDKFRGEKITSKDLYDQLSLMQNVNSKPSKDWPNSNTKFSRRLQMIREALKEVIDITWRKERNITNYVIKGKTL